ncbi:MLP-like protein 31 [Silene latifolia]|uniref:MLP-like protein 31 n=1 Tax=Silene latifolia TaxID=37657 RepID=UPI003D76A87C
MAKIQKMDGKVELNCSAEKVFETLRANQPNVSQLCSDAVPGVTLHQGDWHCAGSTFKWDLNMGGKPTYVVERTDAIDVENMKITRSIIDGELLTHYKSLKTHFQPIPKGNGKSCVMTYSLEYEKIDENAPEPHEFYNFCHGVFKKLGHQLSTHN